MRLTGMAIINDKNSSAGKGQRASHALLERIDVLQDFYDFSPVGYLTLDKNGRILEANLTAAIILKVVRKEINGQLFYDYVVQDDRDILYSHLRNLFITEKPSKCTLRLQDRNGARLYADMDSIYDKIGRGRAVCKSIVADVTDRVHTELKLRESEERFRLMADSSADVIFQLDSKGLILYSSPSGAKILGYTPAEVKETPFENFVFTPDIPKARKMFQRLTFGKKVASFEVYLLAKSGTPVPFEVNASPLFSDDKVRFIVGIARDITERKRTEEELEKERFHLTKAQEIGRIGTWDLDVKENRLLWTEEAYHIFGIPVGKELTYESFLDCVHPQDKAYVESKWSDALNKKPYDIEHRIIVDGDIKWVRNKAELIFDENGDVIRGIGSVQDITDRKQLEEELRKSRDELELRVQERTEALTKANQALQAEVEKRKRYEEALKGSTQKILQESGRRRFVARRLVDTLEKDRRDVAMDLHDQIGQMLATLKMDLERVKGDKKSGNDLSKVSEQLDNANDKITNIMKYVRGVSRRLRPDILDTLGLIPALRSLVESYREEGRLRIHFYYRELTKEMKPDTSLPLYRITQEALNNVVKHAQAKQVFVNLILKNHSIQLSVEDDGIGFDYANKINDITTQKSLGIMIMNERAMIAGGELSVESEIGKGTHVVVEIPID
jgi:PAS domain S-box-containing protein